MDKIQIKFLLKKYRTPKHIICHMQKVAAVGLFLAKKMNGKKGKKVQVNEQFVEYGSLLHDIVKIVDFPEVDETKLLEPATVEDIQFWKELITHYYADKHCLAGYKILIEFQEIQLAQIVRKHGFNSLTATDVNDRPTTWEEKIVYYADKRVRHDQVVSLHERLEDGRKRYFPDGNVPSSDVLVQQALEKLERELCTKAGIQSKDISELSVESFIPEI